MDSLRYYVALFTVASTPGICLYWFSIHPFVEFWRKVGARQTVAIHMAVIVLLAAAVFLLRGPILAVEYGTNPAFLGIAAAVFAAATILRIHVCCVFKNKVLAGLPELAPDEYGSRLVTSGIYAHIRHPRYVQMVLFALGAALLANYLAVYVILALSIPWVGLLVPLEEKELRARFGEEYLRYAERVPRFVPRLQRRVSGS
jgi:protein-S-isoprenylcysteine O-methyltransferase Ste14